MIFLDVTVFKPNAKRHANIELSKAYKINEKEKKRTYNIRILQVEHGSFTPLVMSVTERMSCECKKFYSCLAEMICMKKKKKKKKKQQFNNHMDPKKNCIFVNKINWNMHTWKPLSFSE